MLISRNFEANLDDGRIFFQNYFLSLIALFLVFPHGPCGTGQS